MINENTQNNHKNAAVENGTKQQQNDIFWKNSKLEKYAEQRFTCHFCKNCQIK